MTSGLRNLIGILGVAILIGGGGVLWWRIEKRRAIQPKSPQRVEVNGQVYRQSGPTRWTEEGENYDALWRRVAYIGLGAGAVMLAIGIFSPVRSHESASEGSVGADEKSKTADQ